MTPNNKGLGAHEPPSNNHVFLEGESYIIFPIYWLGVSFFLGGSVMISQILMIYLRVGDWRTLLLVDALSQMRLQDVIIAWAHMAHSDANWGCFKQ